MAFTYIVGSKNYPTIQIFLYSRPWASALGPKVIFIINNSNNNRRAKLDLYCLLHRLELGLIFSFNLILSALNWFNSQECQKFHPKFTEMTGFERSTLREFSNIYLHILGFFLRLPLHSNLFVCCVRSVKPNNNRIGEIQQWQRQRPFHVVYGLYVHLSTLFPLPFCFDSLRGAWPVRGDA